jgi:hypothetical protein
MADHRDEDTPQNRNDPLPQRVLLFILVYPEWAIAIAIAVLAAITLLIPHRP